MPRKAGVVSEFAERGDRTCRFPRGVVGPALGVREEPDPQPDDARVEPEGVPRLVGTGGALYQGEFLSEPTLFGTFERAFANFRQSYVLRYIPAGVARTQQVNVAGEQVDRRVNVAKGQRTFARR
jgi:hypothetical protein